MAFQSEFQDNGKLNDCAVNDRDHISETDTPKGPWVELIKKALNAWAAKQNPPLSPLPMTDTYDSATGDRVALYKTRQTPPILNFAGKIDRIVGKKTVAALDKELPAKTNPTPPPPPVVKKSVDIIVKFRGTLRDIVDLDDKDEVFPDALLTVYKTKPNRRLKKMGRTTKTIREDSKALIAEFVKKINDEIKADEVLGKVFIYGSSSGGRNALALAAELKVPIEFVAPVDAAFFPDGKDSILNSPENLTGDPKTVPLLKVADVTANTKLNFFQTLGNHSEITFRGRAFTSEMDGKEIHGSIVGFKDQKMNDETKALRPAAGGGDTFDDSAHKKLSQAALPKVHEKIKEILDAL